jgi:ABC-2 type transport system permease protein
MRTFLVLLSREVRSLFYTPIAYVMLFFFLALMGFNFQGAVSAVNQGPTEVTLVEITFFNIIFWFTYPLIFPLITMRSFSEEYRMGTIETLSTAPVNDWQIVLSKFFGALTFYVILFLPTLLYFASFTLVIETKALESAWHSGLYSLLREVSHLLREHAAAGTYGSTYLLLLLLGMFFISIGIFASSLVKDQVNAAIISLTTVLLYLFVPNLLGIMVNSTDPRFTSMRGFLSPFEHMRDFSRGMVDTRQIVWYLSMTVLLLVITHQVFQSRKLKAA